MVESFARKYTLENTAKGEGIIRIAEKRRHTMAGAPFPFTHTRDSRIVTH